MSRSRNNGHPTANSTTPSSAPRQPGDDEVSSAVTTQAEMAQAFREIAKGEQQAAAMEADLARFESKLDALLASIEAGGSGTTAPVDGNNEGASEEGDAPESKK